VGVLGAALAFVDARLPGIEIRPQGPGDPLAGAVAGLVGDAHRIRTHVGDERRGPAFAELHAFVEALGHGHGPLGVEAELVAGVLLQGGRDERGARVTLAFLLDNVFDEEGLAVDAAFQGQGRAFVVQDRLFPVHLPQVRVKRRRRLALDRDLENPVFLGNESLAFTFPVHDEAQGHGLDPACGQAAFDFFQSRGEIL
jgi:GNAT superfamily N-acetyltransferase